MPSELNAEELPTSIDVVEGRCDGETAYFEGEEMADLRNVLAAAEAHLATLRAPKVNADWRAELMRHVEAYDSAFTASEADAAKAAINTILDTLEPHAPKDELAEAKAELGAWLAAEEGRTHYVMRGSDGFRVSLYRQGDSDVSAETGYPRRPFHGAGTTEAAQEAQVRVLDELVRLTRGGHLHDVARDAVAKLRASVEKGGPL